MPPRTQTRWNCAYTGNDLQLVAEHAVVRDIVLYEQFMDTPPLRFCRENPPRPAYFYRSEMSKESSVTRPALEHRHTNSRMHVGMKTHSNLPPSLLDRIHCRSRLRRRFRRLPGVPATPHRNSDRNSHSRFNLLPGGCKRDSLQCFLFRGTGPLRAVRDFDVDEP